jgi:hypothetical protein
LIFLGYASPLARRESAEAGARAMLLAFRLADLSALGMHYAGIVVVRQSGSFVDNSRHVNGALVVKDTRFPLVARATASRLLETAPAS